MVTVKVCSQSSGKSVAGVKVFVCFTRWDRGWLEEWTDSSGEAHFDADPGQGVVHVRGAQVWEGRLGGRVVVYV